MRKIGPLQTRGPQEYLDALRSLVPFSACWRQHSARRGLQPRAAVAHRASTRRLMTHDSARTSGRHHRHRHDRRLQRWPPHGRRPERRLLDRQLGRCRHRLRRRPRLRVSRALRGQAGQADHRHGGHARRAGLLARGSDGGVFTYGDAKFYGSTGAIHLNQPIVGMAATPDGQGYWLVASDGGIFTFGDAKVLRFDRGHPPQPAHRRHGGDAGRAGLLARGLRRRHLHVRRRRVLRLHRGHPPQPAHRGHGAHTRRAGLLAGGQRRRHLHLR